MENSRIHSHGSFRSAGRWWRPLPRCRRTGGSNLEDSGRWYGTADHRQTAWCRSCLSAVRSSSWSSNVRVIRADQLIHSEWTVNSEQCTVFWTTGSHVYRLVVSVVLYTYEQTNTTNFDKQRYVKRQSTRESLPALYGLRCSNVCKQKQDAYHWSRDTESSLISSR